MLEYSSIVSKLNISDSPDYMIISKLLQDMELTWYQITRHGTYVVSTDMEDMELTWYQLHNLYTDLAY